MWPTITEVQTVAGPIGIHTYGLFIVLAFSSAFLLIHLRAAKVGINPDRLVAGYVAAAIGGLSGGRLLYALAVEPARTFSEPWSLFSCAGFAVYGGVLGGIVGVWVFVRMAHLSLWKMADLAAPAVVLGMGVGRFGCFSAGCCHGGVAPIGPHPVPLLEGWFPGGQLWWSGTFPYLTMEFHSGAGNVSRLLDVPLYPTQLWSAIVLCALAGLLAWVWTKRRYDGQIAALTLIVEPPFRMFVEAFRADHRGYFVSFPVSESVARWLPGMAQAGSELGTGATIGITTSQGIGLAMMLGGVAIWLARRNTTAEVTQEVRAAEGDLADDLA